MDTELFKAQPGSVQLIANPVYDLSDKCIEYGSNLQGASADKYKNSSEKIISREVFTRSHEQVLVYHRAALCLCESGWAHTAQPLLKVMFEALVNCIIVAKKDSEFRAFQMYVYEYFRLVSYGVFPKKVIQEIDQRIIERLASEKDKKRAREFLSRKPNLYWYSNYYKGPRDLIKQEFPSLLENYNLTCSASHAGQMGYKMFDSEYWGEDINPRRDRYSANTIVVFSIRYLLEFNALRDHYEELKNFSRYETLLKELVVLRPGIEKLKSKE